MKSLVLGILIISFSAHSARIKLATLVPKGTNWAKTLTQMTKEIEKATDKKVRFKIYFGGTQGDEPDVLRKLRIGQLHGGIFTGKTLGDISSDVRSIEVPFNFYHDEKKALDAIKDRESYFNQKIEKKGFVNLGFYGIGKVYVVSTKKVTSIAEMKGIKMWAWEGDKVVAAMIDSLGLVSVPLAITDVTSSLSTGIIDAAYAPPLGILALQWQNKIKYLIDFPTAYSLGALLISKRQWKKLSPSEQGIVKDISKKYIHQANELAIADNKKSLEILKKSGVEFIKFSEDDLKQAEEIRQKVLAKLKGAVLSKQIIKSIESLR